MLLDRRDCRVLGQNIRLRHKPKAFKPKAYPLEKRAHMQNMSNSSANATQNSPAKELDFKKSRRPATLNKGTAGWFDPTTESDS